MHFSTSAAFLALSAVILPLATARPFSEERRHWSGSSHGHSHGSSPSRGCTFAKKNAAVQAELKTIASHSASDAAKIPLAPDASRTFYVTPNELPEVTLPVNVGFSAETVRLELVLLATALNAGVPPKSIHIIDNANGTVTSDFIQTDDIALPRVHVREIHTFNAECQIETIIGYVHGDLICPVSTVGLNSVLVDLCDAAEAAGLVGQLQPTTNAPSGSILDVL